MKDKVVIVTGANGGLGTYVTRDLLAAGATVVGVSRNIQRADFDEGRFSAVQAELSTADGAKTMVERVLAQHGRIDGVAHTVGGFAGGKSVADTEEATFQGMLDVNLNSTFYLLRSVLPAMRKARRGRIVAIGSRAALEPGAGVGAYSASKAAMVSLIRTVASENKDVGITANVILPGTMDTPMNRKFMPNADFSKWVHPANVASLVSWLLGDSGRDVNGAVIPVYGSDV